MVDKSLMIQYLMDYLRLEDKEKFYISDCETHYLYRNPFCFINGILYNGDGGIDSEVLGMIIYEECSVNKLDTFIPEDGEKYYYIGADGCIESACFFKDSLYSLAMAKCGWAFKTEEEARANKVRISKEMAEVLLKND